MPRLILARHGQTAYNAARRYQGQTDIPLNDTGLRQAQALRRRLVTFKIDAAYTSDLQRASLTASIALEGHSSGLQPILLPALREVNGGRFEGLTWEDIHLKYPEVAKAWRADRTSVPPPDGEPLEMVAERVRQVLSMVLEQHPEENCNVLLVLHGGIIGVMLCHLLGMELKRIWQWRTDTCAISILDLYQEGAIVALYNDTSHMEND